uniref:Calcium binding protein 4 n=1 Tax=Eptatretus burgeri TaxID=7764 RepID=A0A8C4R415_EPTBU
MFFSFSELRAAFKELGRDGQLETRKLGAALRALGFMPSEMHLLELTQHVSLNLGGRVTCDDFIDILIPKVLAETRGCFGPRELHLAFNQLDTNGDGLVSLPELRQALRSLLDEPLPAADVEEVLRDGDLNGDGRLDFTEFAKMMSR